MKSGIKIYLFALLTILPGLLFSQLKRGSFLTGAHNVLELGSFKEVFETNWARENRIVDFSITPMAGYFLDNNLAFGIIPSYQYHMESFTANYSNSNYSTRTHTYIFSPFVRYYFGFKRFKMFLDFGMGYKTIRSKTNRESYLDSDTKYIANMSLLNAGGGFLYLIDENFSIDLGIQYGYSDFTGKTYYTDSHIEEVTRIKELKSYASFIYFFRCKKDRIIAIK